MFDICKEFTDLGIRATFLMERWLAGGEEKRGLNDIAIEAELMDLFSRRAQLDAECRSLTQRSIPQFLDGMRALLAPVEEDPTRCTCGAKTPQPEYHDIDCPVRVRAGI